MIEKTAVILITGFLGSGKTTLLNRIISMFPEELKLTILMNEFGEIGIDGTMIEGDDIDMLEISRGSIFCVCVKTDFIKGLCELNARVKPDLLIIESTGVANPSDLKRDLKLPIFHDRFEFTEQFCIIDAAHFLEAFEIFASVEKQLSTSTRFIINKTDLVPPEVVEEIKDLVREHHPDPTFYETTFAQIPIDSVPIPNVQKDGKKPIIERDTDLLSPQDLDNYISELLDNPEGDSTPPDQLASVTYVWHGHELTGIEMMARSLPEGVIRAKGFINENSTIHLFSYVMGDWTINPSGLNPDDVAHMNMIVFIGTFQAIDGISSRIDPGTWSAREILQPFGQIGTM